MGHRYFAAGLLIALAAVLFPFYRAAYMAPAVGYFHDDGIYAASARSLAEGRGYRIPSLPGEPPQTKYPVLFPAVLAAIWKLWPEFPANVWALKLVPLAATIGWLVVTRQLLARLAGRRAASWIVALTAATPLTITFSGTLMADAPFALAITSALLWAHAAESRERNGRTLAIAAVLAAASFHTKTAGIAVIAAAVLSLALRRRWRDAAWFAGMAGALCLPWILWQARHAVAQDSYNSWEAYAVSWNVVLNFTPAEKLAVVAKNALWMSLPPLLPPGLLPPVIAFALSLAFTALVTLGAVRDGIRKPSVVHVFFVLYGLMLLLWAWPPRRFLVAALPLAIYFAMRGIEFLLRPEAARLACRAGLAAALALVLIALMRTGTRAHTRIPVSEFHRNTNWGLFEAAMVRLRESTPPDAVVLGSRDPAVWLYSGRKAVREINLFSPYELSYAPGPPDPERHWRDLVDFVARHKVTHIMVDAPCEVVSLHRRDALRIIREHRPDLLGSPRDLGGGYTLYAIRGPRPAPSSR